MPTFATNNDAPYKYELEDKFEAGIVLLGSEVKSVRNGQMSLRGSYVSIHPAGASLHNAHITPYPHATKPPDPLRERRLLLGKHELIQLQSRVQGDRLTIVPLSVYGKGGFIKVELALARGKRKADKRASIKAREVKRRVDRALRERQRG